MAAPLGLLSNESKDYSNEITVFSDQSIQESIHLSLLEETFNSFEAKANESLYDEFQRRMAPNVKKLLNDTQKAEAYLKWVLDIQCTADGCDSLKDVSAKGVAEYDEPEGSLLIGWKGKGYGSIIDLLLKRHKKSQGPPINLEGKLHLNTEVASVTKGSNGIQVQCKDGSIFPADLVIVTVSLAVLKDRHATLFQPPLPNYKKKAIEAIGIDTVDKIILRFPHIWWPTNVSGFEIVWLEKDKSLREGQFPWEHAITAFESEDGSPYTLTGWISGKAARSMETHSIEDVKVGAMRVLKKFLGHKYSIPEPVEVLRSTWGTNPHFRGVYSYRSVAAEALNVTAADLINPLTDYNGNEVIFFAGEATSPKRYGTVNGAIETGWREADRIIQSYKI